MSLNGCGSDSAEPCSHWQHFSAPGEEPCLTPSYPGETWVPREGEGGRYEHCLHLEGRDDGSGAWGVAMGSI